MLYHSAAICCGSGSDFGKVLVPAPDPDNTLFSTIFQQQKFVKNHAFLMSEAAYLPESWPVRFFYFLLHFILDPDLNTVPEPEP